MMPKLDWLMGKKKKNPKKRRNWENFNIHWIMISRITRSEGGGKWLLIPWRFLKLPINLQSPRSGKVISPWFLLICVDILIFISSFYVLLICVMSHDCSGLPFAVGFLCSLETLVNAQLVAFRAPSTSSSPLLPFWYLFFLVIQMMPVPPIIPRTY